MILGVREHGVKRWRLHHPARSMEIAPALMIPGEPPMIYADGRAVCGRHPNRERPRQPRHCILPGRGF